MGDYSLSKRTDVYLQGAWMRVSGGKTDSIVDGGYVVGAEAPSSTSNQFILRAAMRHKF
jgi:predicted porin